MSARSLFWHSRLPLIGLPILLGLFLVAGKLFYVQVLKGDTLRVLAGRAHSGQAESSSARGDLVDMRGETLAISVPGVSLSAHPPRLSAGDVDTLCTALREHGLGDRCAALRSDRNFVWVARQLSAGEYDELVQVFRRVPAAGVQDTWLRRYPKGQLAGPLLGFVGLDGQGLEGLERSLDDWLRPEAQAATVLRDARRQFLLDPADLERLMPRRRTVELTIDLTTQALVEEALAGALREMGGKSAVALVAELETGAIRAAAVAPGFDPNRFREHGPADWRPRFSTDAYEPGSTVKPLLLAAALLEGQSPHEIIWTENGRYRVDEHVIRDDEPMGWLSLRNIVVRSSNIGSAKLGERIGRQQMYDFYRSLGFGEPVAIDMPGEARGILRPPQRWSALDWATISFGQGLSATPLHLLKAYAIVAGLGSYRPLHVVERVLETGSGRVLWEAPHEAVAVFPGREEVFSTVLDVMHAVVEEGTGRRARIEGLSVGGKTGTAQKPDLERGGYREGAYVAWFAGVFPAHRPRFVAVVLVDEPELSIYGGAVAAPVFRSVAEVIAIRHGLLGLDGHRERARDARLPVARRHSTTSTGDAVPDLRGLGLRAAGRLAQAHGATLVPEGSGRVVRQEPAPGSAPNGGVWRVQLAEGERT